MIHFVDKGIKYQEIKVHVRMYSGGQRSISATDSNNC